MTPIVAVTLAALASYRLTRVITRDSIGDRAREMWFDRWPYSAERGRVRVDWQQWRYRPTGGAFMLPRTPVRPLSSLGQLVNCPACLGWWISGLVTLAAAALGFVPWAWSTMALWPAVAGGQTLLSFADARLTS
jgi:uncharacterized protein DUF1360